MDHQIDTAQQRAAQALYCRLWLEDPQDPKQFQQNIAHIADALQQARREALEEAAKVCNDFREQARHQDLSGGYTADLIANQLDRLREGVKG